MILLICSLFLALGVMAGAEESVVTVVSESREQTGTAIDILNPDLSTTFPFLEEDTGEDNNQEQVCTKCTTEEDTIDHP